MVDRQTAVCVHTCISRASNGLEQLPKLVYSTDLQNAARSHHLLPMAAGSNTTAERDLYYDSMHCLERQKRPVESLPFPVPSASAAGMLLGS